MAGEATIATAYVQLVPSLSGVQGAIGEAFGGPEVEQAANQAGEKAGGSLLDGLKKIAGPAAIAGIAAGLFAVGSTFDDVSDSIRTATGKTGAELDTMVEQAKKIGTTVPVEFDKIGPALSKVSQRLGLTGDDLTNVTSQFLAAGNVLGQDVNIDKASASLAAFGIQGADVSGALDNVFKISQQTGTGFDEITSAIQTSAPALKQLGFSFEESAALVGQLDKAGLNSTATLGAMSKGMVKLAKDGKDPQQAFQEISGQIGDLVAQGKDAEAIDLASGLFGTKGAAQFVEATKNGSLNVADLTASIGANSESILGAQEDTGDFAESWTLFKNKALVAIEPVATAVFNFAGQAMAKLLEAFDNIGVAVDAVVGFFTEYKDVIIALGVVVLALSSSLIAQTAVVIAQQIAITAVSVATKAWSVAQAALNLVMNANPIMLVVAGIAALVAGVIWAYQNVEWFRDIVDGAWQVISSAASWAWENVIKPVFDALSLAVSTVIDWFSNFGANLSGILSSIGGWIANAWQAILDFFTGLPGKVWEILLGAASLIAEYGWKFLDWYYGGIIRGAIALFQWFTDLAPMIWEKILAFAGFLAEKGAEFIGWIGQGITDGAVALWQWFVDLPGYLWNGLLATVGAAGTWALERGGEFIGWIKNGIVDGAKALWAFFSGGIDDPNSFIGGIWASLQSVSTKVLQFGKDVVGWIVDGVKAVASTIWDAITAVLGGDDPADNPLTGNQPGVVFGGVKDGGRIPLAGGGAVRRPGTGMFHGRGGPRADLNHVLLSDGEFVVNAAATDRTLPLLEKINAGKFAEGGMVGTEAAAKKVGSALAWGYANKAIEELRKPLGDFSNGNWGPGSTTGFAANAAAAKAYIEANFKGVSSIGGLYGGSVSGSDHPMGKALDVMIANYGSAAGIAAGNAIADWFQSNAGVFGTKYEIWRKQYRKPGENWSPYSHPSGSNDTLDHNDHVHLSFLTGSGEFQGAAPTGIATVGGAFSTIVSSLRSKMGIRSAPVSGGSGVERWRQTVLQGLALIGQPASLADTVLNQIRTESSGNQFAINLTDSNARKGTPSKGLIQAIDSTFNAYRLPQLSSDIYDALSNIVAGMRYAISRYGSIQAGMRGVAYDDGGWLMPNSTPVNKLHRPEPVLAPYQWDIAGQAIDLVSRGAVTGGMTVNIYQQPGQSPAELAREMDRLIKFHGASVMA